jgi:hypothetical protein
MKFRNFSFIAGFFLSQVLSQLAFAQSGNLSISPDMLHFDYAQNEGDVSLDCTQTLEDPQAQDWIVNCGTDKTILRRKYRVHLWVTMYEHPVAPQQSYEVLYWVSDLSPQASSQSSASSTTVWFNFESLATVAQIDLRLGVENDIASLHLLLTPNR